MWLNTTSLVSPEIYTAQWNILTRVQAEITTENPYGIVMLVFGFGIPILCTVLGYVPFVSRPLKKLKPNLVWPSTIGTYQVRPLPHSLGNAPTMGQALYIAAFIILNVVFMSVHYISRQPNAWYSIVWSKIMAYVLWRTGNLAYIIAPLIFLFGGRNNILLWLTNWSHSTYMVLHRWVDRVFAVQAILHSLVGLVLYKHQGTYDENVKESYWIWCIVATASIVVLTIGSGLYVRKLSYELFLVVHIVLSVILVVGLWYHVYDLYKFLGGVEDWIYAICAVWFADRLMRTMRIVTIGPCRARVTELGGLYVRIDIPGIRWGSEPGKHVYAYFPTLNPLRFWENHPFSVFPTALLQPFPSASNASPGQRPARRPEVQLNDLEKQDDLEPHVKPVQHNRPSVGLTLYIRKSTGMTRLLRADDHLLTLLEGPYPNNSTREVLRCDRLLLIAGGIGVTALLPFFYNHWNVKLAWSVKESAKCLANDLAGTISTISDRDIRIDRRLDVEQLLADEMKADWDKVGVVVSWPAGLCDSVRAAVTTAAKLGKTEFELEVEAYSW